MSEQMLKAGAEVEAIVAILRWIYADRVTQPQWLATYGASKEGAEGSEITASGQRGARSGSTEAVVPEWLEALADGRVLLVQEVNKLLARNMTKLMGLCYHLDVPEVAVTQAFAETSLPEIGQALAALMIEREVQKARSRQHWQQRFGLRQE